MAENCRFLEWKNKKNKLSFDMLKMVNKYYILSISLFFLLEERIGFKKFICERESFQSPQLYSKKCNVFILKGATVLLKTILLDPMV